jgi:phage shock protein C
VAGDKNPLARPLRRSVANRWIAGVCGGIAEYFDLDPTLVRVVYVLLSIFSAAFPGTLVYIILWIVIPEREYI